MKHQLRRRYGRASKPKPSVRAITLLRRMDGFRNPRDAFFGNDLRDIDRLVALGFLTEHGKGPKRAYTVSRAGKDTAHPFGIYMGDGR